MKLEDQVCSLEFAKKLKELGVKQESLWYWVEKSELINGKAVYSWVFSLDQRPIDFAITEPGLSAFTVAELLNMLRKYKDRGITIPTKVNVANWLAQEVMFYEESFKKN